MTGETRYTARVHRFDGGIALLGAQTGEGEPARWIDLAVEENEPAATVRRYMLRTNQDDAPDTYDYEFSDVVPRSLPGMS